MIVTHVDVFIVTHSEPQECSLYPRTFSIYAKVSSVVSYIWVLWLEFCGILIKMVKLLKHLLSEGKEISLRVMRKLLLLRD